MQLLEIVAVVLAMTLPASESATHGARAAAGAPQSGWNDIAKRVKPGEEMIVEDHSRTLITGTFVAINGTELVLWVGGAEKQWAQSNVRTLTRVRTTRSRRGILIGAVAGAALLFLSISDEEDFSPRGRLVFASIGAGAGAAIGTAFSGRRSSKEIVYQAPIGSDRLATAPLSLTRDAHCGGPGAGARAIADPIGHSVSRSFGGNPSAGISACR